MKRCIRSFTAFCLLAQMLTLPLPSFAQTAKQTKPSFYVEGGEGLTMARIVSPQGIVRVNLPDDIAAGDTISGTVSVEPAGSNAAEKAQNLDVLNGYVLDLGDGKKVKADKPSFSWTPQISQPSMPLKYVLKVVEVLGSDGNSLASGNIPILTSPPPVPTVVNFPVLGQAGHPVQISGPFDGNSANTNCDIGGQAVSVIAESPRKTIVRAPVNVIGPSPITADDIHLMKANSMIRIVGVNLTAPKTNLMKGEKTTLSVQVIGLQGLTSPVPISIVTTGVVNMQGGNIQNLMIQPGQVGSGGIFTQSFGLTGIQPGAFNVTATVITGPTAGDNKDKKCDCVCKFATPPITPSGSGKRTGRYSYKPNMSNAGCTGSCKLKGIEYSWSIGNGSTAVYTVKGDKTSQELSVEVTGDGTLELTVTVTVKCSDGSTCTATDSKTFDVKK